MAVTNYKTPGTCANVDRGGAEGWLSPDNAKTSNNSYASSGVSKQSYTDWLRVTNFGFTTTDIPSGSTIDGFDVKVEHKASNADKVCDSALYLRKTAGQQGNNKASAVKWGTSDDEITYNWASGQFGTLGESDVRDSGFGVDLSALNSDVVTTVYVDCISVRVYYTAGGVTHYGAATLTGIGTLASIGRGIFIGKATLTGEGTLATIGSFLRYAKSSLSGAGTLSAIGSFLRYGKVSLSGIGTLAAIGSFLHQAKATLTGTGTLTVAGSFWRYAKSSLSGTGSLAVSAQKVISKILSGTLSFEGVVHKVTSKAMNGAISFAGSLIKATSKAIGGAITFAGRLIWAGRRLKMKLFKRPYYDMAVEVRPYRDATTETREVKP